MVSFAKLLKGLKERLLNMSVVKECCVKYINTTTCSRILNLRYIPNSSLLQIMRTGKP